MTTAETQRIVAVRSAGRVLAAVVGDKLIAAWPRIAPHVPGTSSEPLQEGSHAAIAGVVVPDDVGDARRLINAHLHVLHLTRGTVCVHAVAMCRPGGAAVLLLGGHGSGKTLTGLALAARGWNWLAGDVTLVDVASDGGPTVRGGTSAVLGRRASVRRWFPELGLPEEGAEVVDLCRSGPLPLAAPTRLPVAGAVLVDVDGDPLAAGGTMERVDRHTAATVWLHASGHLLDRVLDSGEQPLRLLETGPAQRQRIRYVHTLTGRVGLYAARGAPAEIAAHIEQSFTPWGRA
ncbi:hypothetical protein SAMN05216275_11998 [Streptosporangium canum]|uniref:Hpr(Ser) kinase/phosphatase n=1 Tax=Streptosporangium canum TaxID=324952 RepID=A0A1I3XKY2_9ACTN|nr:hypothetical protein [Streptosporangium canum]SFK20019.1 hypothetical protein SAMN05216275_11998 [Streptosporangium canum]